MTEDHASDRAIVLGVIPIWLTQNCMLTYIFKIQKKDQNRQLESLFIDLKYKVALSIWINVQCHILVDYDKMVT